MLPQTKGATLIYDSFLKDYVNKNESKIDAALNNAKKTLSKSTKDITTAIAEVSEERENPDKEDWLRVFVSLWALYTRKYSVHVQTWLLKII